MEERGEPKHSQRGGRGRDSREEPRGNQEGESLEECRINVSVIPVDLALNPQRLRPSSPGSRVRFVWGPIGVMWLFLFAALRAARSRLDLDPWRGRRWPSGPEELI
ncbi:hypothetical protein PVAP13_2KG203321 [Panicum virgatum]|uniref:Uncharacterized protein n=1 Tax=Panicum virgatum TaxID=38727 RepID=A0A8T0W7V2_PANVG|nr:hypothetical protein PVAP13_2KG203321 [Panicum virgatum]